jgi:hypothetical protein
MCPRTSVHPTKIGYTPGSIKIPHHPHTLKPHHSPSCLEFRVHAASDDAAGESHWYHDR